MTIWLTVLAAYWSLGSKAPSQHEYNKATAKARLAPLDGYKVSHKPRHSRPHHGHSHSQAVTSSNVNLYPPLPLVQLIERIKIILPGTVFLAQVPLWRRTTDGGGPSSTLQVG